MENLFRFYKIISKLKSLPRSGWLKHKIRNPETVASHSFGATLLGWWVAKKEGLDPEKMIKIILVHELVEAIVGDITPQDHRYDNKRKFEKKFINVLGGNIPLELRAEIIGLVEEYTEGKTLEAQVASGIEKLETILQAQEYEKKLKRKIAREFFDFYKNKINFKSGKEILKCLKGKMP